jgi:P4 family phage/plasmid primase-like protien
MYANEEDLFSESEDEERIVLYTFAQDLNESGAKKPLTMSEDEAFQEDQNLHEVITGRCIPYGDYDGKYEQKPDIKDIYNKFKLSLDEAFPNSKIIIGNRSGVLPCGLYKVSFRFWIRNHGYFKSPPHCGQYVQNLLNPILIKNGLELLDHQPYMKRQNMGLATHTKLGDPRILKIPKDVDPKLTLIQKIDEENYIEVKLRNTKSSELKRECPEEFEEIMEMVHELMPGVRYNGYKNNKNLKIIALTKSQDECPIHQRTHAHNCNYIVYSPDNGIAKLKCHDDEEVSKPYIYLNKNENKLINDKCTDINDKCADIKDKCADIYQYIDDYPELENGDQGLSRIFVKHNKENIKIYNKNMYYYDESKALWTHLEDMDELSNIVSDFMPGVIEEKMSQCNDEQKRKYERLRIYTLNLSGSLKIARKAVRGLNINEKEFLKFNAIGHYVPIRNKLLVNLKTGKTEPREKHHLFTFEYDVDYCKEFSFVQGFMNQIACNRSDLCEYLQKLLGCCLTDLKTRKFYIFLGDGINGKTTITEAMSNIMSKHFSYVKKTVLIKDRFGKQSGSHDADLGSIRSARVIVCKELDNKDQLNSGQVKALADNSKISIRLPYEKNNVEVHPCLKVLCETNVKPLIDSNDPAILDRLVYVPFDARFCPNPTKPNEFKIDTSIKRKITNDTPERSQFFSWLVQGAIKMYKEDIEEPECVLTATNEEVKENDYLYQFIEENCSLNPSNGVFVEDFIEAYKDWYQQEYGSYLDLQKRPFNKIMRKRGYNKRKTNGRYKYMGLDLLE